MKTKIRKYLMVVTMVAGMLFSVAMPAFAYTGGAGQADTETGTGTVTGNISVETEDTEDAPITEEPSDTESAEAEESQGRVQGTPFSVPGNGQLVDDMEDDESKQFLTIQTKNGNTFFMVIDRSRNSENVYMLSLVDEYDLAEFIEEEETEPVEEKPAVIVEEPQPEPVQEEPQPEKGGMGMGALLTIILLGAGGVGGYYYFKILKPKREEEEAESEDLEFYDGGAYVNEDQENGQEEEENEE